MTFGLLNVSKPSGPTSHDIVKTVRRGTGVRRVGHTGTLDPLAGGVLVLALGTATRLAEYLTGADKTYKTEITLGIETDTYDTDGAIVVERPIPVGLTPERVEQALAAFRGEIEQVPPAYSAVKVRGRSAHARMRAGEAVALSPRRVTIHRLALVEFDPPALGLEVVCSAGTYVRSLAHDLGIALGCGAALSRLVRTASGCFTLEDAIEWDTLQAAFADGSWPRFLLPADLALEGTPRVRLDENALRRVATGLPLQAEGAPGSLARAYAPDGRFVAVLRGDPQAGVWRPAKVFV